MKKIDKYATDHYNNNFCDYKIIKDIIIRIELMM